MPGQCVIGLQWGDEAKGKLVDLLTENKDLVVRYQGGANAGHTIVIGKQVYKLHHIPSGIIHSNVMNLIAPGVVVNPPTILREIQGLEDRGIDVASRLKISSRAHVVMPWHILEDQLWNRLVAGADNIGTTLRGIGPCYADKVGRSFAFRMGDLLQADFPGRVRKVAAIKQLILSAAGGDEFQLDAESIISEFAGYADKLGPLVADTNRILLDAVDDDQAILFEGAQGSLLDIDHGTFPFVTSSNSSGVGISPGSGVPGNWLSDIIGVCKVYSTRVGGGPFPTELDDEVGEHIRQRGREFGTTTGRPRRCGWFDAVAVRYTARLGGVTSVALTMLDVLSELKTIQICVGYQLNGSRIDYFPDQVNDLRNVVPIWESIPGWQQEIREARSLDDLPIAAVRYVQRLEELIGRRVAFVSVGPDRAETIFIDKNLQLKEYLLSRASSTPR